jgi:hypothetical protein
MSQHDREPDDAAALEQRLRADLRRLVADTPPEIRERLQDMARAAAREPLATRRPRTWRLGLPVGIGIGAAAASALLLVLWRPVPAPPEERSPLSDDLALLLNVDNLDLLEQMEFYQWLDREPALLDSAANPGAQRS